MTKFIKEFIRNDTKIKVLFRDAVKEDLEGIWKNFNSIVRDGIYIPIKTEVTSEFEKSNWLMNHEIEKNIVTVAVDITDNNKENFIIGQCVIEHLTWEAADHVGELGIIINEKYRDIKIGKELMLQAIQKAIGLFKKINLAVFHDNHNAIHLYEKIGFKKVGLRPKQYFLKDKYYDEILMDYFIEK